MLKSLLSRSVTALIALVALAAATMLCVVAAAYGIYALLRLSLSPAPAAGITALVAALVAAVLAFVLRRAAPVKTVAPASRRQVDPDMLRQVVGLGAVLASLVADATLRNRLDHKSDKRRNRGRKQRR